MKGNKVNTSDTDSEINPQEIFFIVVLLMIYIPKWVLTLMERGRIKCSRQGNVGEGTSERGPTWLAASKGEWTVEMWVIRIPAGIGRHEWSVTWHHNQYGQSDLVLVLNSQHTHTWPTLQHTAASTQWLKTLHLNMFLWLFHPSFISPKIQYSMKNQFQF